MEQGVSQRGGVGAASCGRVRDEEGRGDGLIAGAEFSVGGDCALSLLLIEASALVSRDWDDGLQGAMRSLERLDAIDCAPELSPFTSRAPRRDAETTRLRR